MEELIDCWQLPTGWSKFGAPMLQGEVPSPRPEAADHLSGIEYEPCRNTRLTSRCLTRPCHGRSRQGLGICQSSRLQNCFVNLPGKIPWGSADVHARVPLHAQAPRMFHFRVLESGGIWTSPHTGLMVPVHVTEFWEPRHAEYCSLRIGWLILDMQVS